MGNPSTIKNKITNHNFELENWRQCSICPLGVLVIFAGVGLLANDPKSHENIRVGKLVCPVF
jgi:hypothetical protein